MSNMLLINTLINWKEDGKTERILWIDNNNNIAFVINIYGNTYSPVCRNISDLKLSLIEGNVTVLDEDPWTHIITEEEINESSKFRRDKAWEIVTYILNNCGVPGIYNSNIRGKCVKEVSNKFNITEKSIYGYLMKYWQRGANRDCLLPDYYNCGCKGKEKDNGNKKRGRPKKYGIYEGVNVDEKIKEIIRLSITKFYYTTKENSLKTAYELMRREYFSDGYKFEEQVRKPLLLDSSNAPSYQQFVYWYNKNRILKEKISKRKSSKRYFLENREILGNSTHETLGPGSIFQIDATIMDIYLVSRYDRKKIIARPILYNVIDVYSHMIVGLAVTLEGPSYVGAMVALSNATMNKVEFCSKYGINIKETEWPVNNCIPEYIIADRGELEGKNIENIISGLNIKISNTASYRGDMKGIVERYFNTINTRIKPFVPGVVGGDFAMRGSVDYRLEAKLDIYQLTQIMIKCTLYHNNHHWMDNYKREKMMIEDELSQIPLAIWNWGLENKSGKLRTASQNMVKLNLLPRLMASVTGKGILFKGIYYGSEIALKEKWFEKARNEGSWKIEVLFDPQNMDCIYIINDGGRNVLTCLLLKHEDRYKNRTLEEIEILLEYEKKMSNGNKDLELQSKSDLISEIEAIVKESEKQADKEINSGESKTQRLKNIRKNRVIEKLINREQEKWKLNEVCDDNVDSKKSSNENDENLYLEEDIELIKNMRRERFKNDKANTNQF